MPTSWVDYATLSIATIAAWATISAAVAAKRSAEVSTSQFENQVTEQKRLERPRLVPLNHKISQKPDQVLREWAKNDSSKTRLLIGTEGFSNYTIPIINTGNSFAIDVKYCFEFEDGIDSIKPAVFEGVTLSEPEYIKKYEDNNFFRFTVSEDPNQGSLYSSGGNFFYGESIPYFRYISIIRSKEEEEISIPSYFVVLSNLFLLKGIGKSEHESLRPNLLLTIIYKDQYNKEHVDVYRMRLSDKHIASKDSAMETWIDFKFVDPNKK